MLTSHWCRKGVKQTTNRATPHPSRLGYGVFKPGRALLRSLTRRVLRQCREARQAQPTSSSDPLVTKYKLRLTENGKHPPADCFRGKCSRKAFFPEHARVTRTTPVHPDRKSRPDLGRGDAEPTPLPSAAASRGGRVGAVGPLAGRPHSDRAGGSQPPARRHSPPSFRPDVTAADGERPRQQPPLRAHTQCQRGSSRRGLVGPRDHRR